MSIMELRSLTPVFGGRDSGGGNEKGAQVVGVSIWIRLKRQIQGVDPLPTDGKLLARAMDGLDREARKLGKRPLSDFYSVSQKQALAELGERELTEEECEALADDHAWWPPEEGLASVEALLAWVSDNQDKVDRSAYVIADLRDFKTVLEAAVRETTEFNLAVSA